MTTPNIPSDFHTDHDTLLSYQGRAESITVPEGIRVIGPGAFKACVSLKKISLPQSLGAIMAGAFKGCRKLEDIQIPPGVSFIGDYAFHRCHNLRSVSLPPSVEELGDCAFLYCDSLTRISMPGVRRLGKQAFVNDVLLKELVISEELQEDNIRDVFTSCSSLCSIAFSGGETCRFPNTVEVVAGQMKVPSLVRAIAVDVLRMMELDGQRVVKFLTNLKHVEIPEGIESIGKSCFFDKRGILSVKLPASLKEIESRAFRNCIGLETVFFHNDKVFIHKDAFKNCTSLRHIHIGDGTQYTFQGIHGLSGEEIPPLVSAIHRQVMGNFLISGTILLKYLGGESRVAVPHGITVIAEEAFDGNEAVDRVILPDSLLEIGAYAFRGCLLLQTVEFPGRLTRLGTGAFENCVKLIRATLPPGLTEIPDNAFKHCHVLREITFPPELGSIGEQAFYKCSSLRDVIFPEALTSIGEMAFYRCGGLKEICLPPAVTRIGSLAFAQSGVKKARILGEGPGFGRDLFSDCPRLKTLILEPGVRHIPDRLAFGCTALRQVVVPDSLESVGRHPLENTLFLQNLGVKAQNNRLDSLTKTGSPQNNQETDKFLETNGILWDGADLSGDVILPDTVRIVAGGAFYGNKKLTRIHFPENVAWIGPAALKGCEHLTAITWPGHIENVEAEVCSGCVSLETIDTQAHFRAIGERAFSGCRKLKSLPLDHVRFLGKEGLLGCRSLSGPMPFLTRAGENAVGDTSFPHIVGTVLMWGQGYHGQVCLPEGIRSIAPYAFAANQALTGICFPASLEHIGEGAFWGCRNLETVSFSHHGPGIQEHAVLTGSSVTPAAPFPVCRIDDRAFEKCISLKELDIHTDHVGSRAFSFCTSLKKAVLTGLTVLSERLFEGCRNLETCVCPQAETVGDCCFSGCESLLSFDFTGIRHVGSYGFQNCDSLTRLELEDSTSLMPHALEDCGRLEEVRLTGPRGIICLREYAFSGCTALKKAVQKGRQWQLETYRDILSDQLPQMVRLIFYSALSCFLIEDEEILTGYRGMGRIIHIPKGIRQIRAEVFRDRMMIREVRIPDTTDYIGARAFHGTAWLEERRKVCPLVIVNHMVLDGSCCRGQVTVPEEVRLVCGWAFAGGMGIRRIRFLSDRVRVEEYAFRNCIYLEEMELADGSVIAFSGIRDRQRLLPPVAMQAVTDSLNCFKTDDRLVLVECTGNISDLRVADGITAIGDRVFQDGNLLSRIRLPATVTSIGRCAFAGCRWLTVVEHAVGVERIEAMAFSGCGRLERIELSSCLRFLGPRAFENCTSLREILIPEGVEEIPERAFFRCHSLEKIHLPSTLKQIGREAFAFCKNLRMPEAGEHVIIGERAF